MFRAGGTSLNGQAQTDSVMVDVRRHWQRARVLDDGAAVRVKPGIVVGQVNRLLARHRRRLGPDPASTDIACVGGVIANNSGGMRCGVVADSYRTVRSLTLVLANGAVIDAPRRMPSSASRSLRPSLLGAEDAWVTETGPEVDTATELSTEPDADADPEAEADGGPVHRSRLGGLGMIVSRVAKARAHRAAVADDTSAADDLVAADADDADHADPEDGSRDLVGDAGHTDDAGAPTPERPAARSAVPMRETRHALRAQVTRDTPATVLGSAALLPDADAHGRRPSLPESRELRRPGGVDLDDEAPDAWYDAGRVRPISTLGEPVEALVIDDFVTEPAYDPVIGPELAAARTRVGLSVDELAERTRIRPHVIESIEVDDFAPCGGDFYARGHLRTLARVLGREPGPLLEQFDQRYATAPINARRVFEAELATGMTGSMRSTVGGGPNWALMVGVVLALVMTWGVIRLFAAQPQENLQQLAPVLNGSAGVGNTAPSRAAAPAPTPKPIRVTLVGAQAGSRAVVRDRDGKVVWAGEIVLGERRTVTATPPVKVRAQDAGALEASVNGRDKGPVGALGQPGTRTFVRPASH